MTKVKNEKDHFEPLDEENPLLEKGNKGNASGVSQEMFEAILSHRLEMSFPDLDSPTLSENQDAPKPIRKDDTDSEDELWFRIYINQRLEVDPPTPDPPTLTEVSPTTPEISQEGDIDHRAEKTNHIPGFQPLHTERSNPLSFLTNDGDIESQIDQPPLDDKFVGEQIQSTPSDPNGNGDNRSDQMDLDFKGKARAVSPIENEVGWINEGRSEILLKPEFQPKRKHWTIFALTITVVLMALSVGTRKFGGVDFEFTSKIDPETISIQSEKPDNLSTELMDVAVLEGVNQPSLSYDGSVLTQIQKDRLYKASLAYLADGEEEAVYMAQSIGYLPNGGHPATMCGPLAIAILRDALLIDRHVDLETFWLLNPRDEYTVSAILEKYFPREHYHWYQTSTPVNYFDFKNYPLYTGDFLYLFAGPGGNFEHMLLVTRVDEEGRVYSVSPIETANGYSITELMLYDPKRPGEGYFYDITNKENAKFGLTGFGGFWMWRRLTPIPEQNLDDLAFGLDLDSIFDNVGGDWHVYIKEVGDRVIYSRNADEIIHPASIIKVPLAIQFFHALDYQGDELREYLSERGVDGRTYMQLLEAMLVVSEEDAAQILEKWIDDQINVKDVFAKWGMLNTSFSPRRSTGEEIGRIFEGLYLGEWVTAEEREIILELMAEFTSNDNTRLGVIQDNLNPNDKFFNKRGSINRQGISVADAAIVEIGGDAFILAIFGYPEYGEMAPTYDELEAAIEDAALVIWEYLSQQDSSAFHTFSSGFE